MITELYRIEPIDGSDIQQLAKEGENLELRESLGLPPLELKDENANFFTYRFLTEDEKKVFSVLFPKQTKIENYKDFIPNEVLTALQEVKETCPHRIVESPMVWHAKEYDPDPILTVGVRTENDEYKFANRHVLIARWGEALKDFSELSKIAFEKWKSERQSKLAEIQEAVELEFRKVERALSIGEVNEPYCNL